ncbi:hypothetical protein BJX68DRAFT_266669 [Aspergillus pseudodeflectus]|uniref:Uncharacterized protein n=1 Tax=Aspergillus pseudodeflectus TaxID=176178 RepID=A0ABR4KDU9_9EURO
MESAVPLLVTTTNLHGQDTLAPPDAVPPGPLSPQTHGYPVHPSPPPELETNPQLTKRGLGQFLDYRNLLGLLWIAPAIALLILNFQGYVIGAGLNCLGCHIDPYSSDRVRIMQHLDRTNRNVLGGLQFVAKTLEVWFMYVAVSLVYRSVLFLSAKDRRLPISLLLAYTEFLDLLFLKDLAMKARKLAKNKRHAAGSTKPVYPAMVVFMLLVTALSTIANLMGIATATLAIPSLQFIDINRNDSLAFSGLLGSTPPRVDEAFRCPEGQLAAGNYSCTAQFYSSSLDQLIESAVSTIWQGAYYLPPVSQEGRLSFSLNTSEDQNGGVWWVPNRQLLRAFTEDVTNLYDSAYNPDGQDYTVYPDSRRFSQALQAKLQRKGPALGLVSECSVDPKPYIYEISEDREIRCYWWCGEQARCIRWGSGWEESAQTASVEFTMPNDSGSQYDMNVTIHETPMARWVLDNCWAHGSCLWDQIFQEPAAANEFNISGPQLTFVYSMPEHTNSTIWCYNVAHLGFADYILNPNPDDNLLGLIQLSVLNPHPSADIESNNTAVAAVHPDWVLAAWSVDPEGQVDPNRGSIARFSNAFLAITDDEQPPSAMEDMLFRRIHRWASAQILSFINYNTAKLSTAQERREQAQRVKGDPLLHSFLPSWATVQVWKFGIESRTSILGVVVMITGIVIVLLTTILWVEPPKTPTELIVSALVAAADGAPIQVAYDRTAKEFRYSDSEEQGVEISTVVVSPKP